MKPSFPPPLIRPAAEPLDPPPGRDGSKDRLAAWRAVYEKRAKWCADFMRRHGNPQRKARP